MIKIMVEINPESMDIEDVHFLMRAIRADAKNYSGADNYEVWLIDCDVDD